MVEFNPKKTVKEVLEETRELFGCESRFESEKMPSVVLGEETRVKYILLCLLQKASTRNKLNLKFEPLEPIRVSARVKEDDALVLSEVIYLARVKFQKS
jgi:hypothetical protein